MLNSNEFGRLEKSLQYNIITKIFIDNNRRIYRGVIYVDPFYVSISAKMRSSVLAVIVPFVILLVPSFLSDFSVLSKILGLLPDQLLRIGSFVNYFNVYQIGSKVIGAMPIIFTIYLICYFILLPLLYRIYKKSELNS